MTIQKSQGAIVRTKTLHLINPGQTKSVTIGDLGQVPFAQKTTVNVDVRPVPGEKDPRTTRRPTRSSSRSAKRSAGVHDTATAALAVASPASRSARSASASPGGRGCGFAVSATRSARCVGGGRKDLVDFAVSLQARIDDLHRAVDEVAAGLARVDRRVDATVTNTAIVRYDAYEDTGGHQSASLALLDSARTGLVLTAIQGRDYARIYMKELERGTRLGRPLARGAGGRRARDGPLTFPLVRLQFQQVQAGTRSQCELRAAQRVLASPRPRARLQGEGRGDRGARSTTSLGHGHLSAGPTSSGSCTTCACPGWCSGRSPAAPCSPVTAGAASTAAHRRPADARPRDPAVSRRRLELGERRHLVRALQSPQGKPAAARGPHGAARAPAAAGAGALHPARDAEDPGPLGAVPRPFRRRTPARTRRLRPPPMTARPAAPGAAPTPTTSRDRAARRARRGASGAGRRTR